MTMMPSRLLLLYLGLFLSSSSSADAKEETEEQERVTGWRAGEAGFFLRMRVEVGAIAHPICVCLVGPR